MPQSNLERAFSTHWTTFARVYADEYPDSVFTLESEFAFKKGWRWKFDFCHKEARVGIEMEGGTFTEGRHVRGKGYRGDCEKYNQAVMMGWKLLRFTSDMLADDPMGCCEMIANLIVKSLPKGL